MENRRRVAVLALMLALVASGCLGPDDPDPVGADTVPDQAGSVQATADTGALHGEVVNSDLVAVVGANLSLVTKDGAEAASTVVARDGRYVLNGIAPGRYNLSATAAGHAPLHEVVDIVAQTVHEHNLMLDRAGDPGRPFVADGEVKGRIIWAVAWHLEPPVVGCVVVPAPDLGEPLPRLFDVKNCGGLRNSDSENTEVSIPKVDERVETILVTMEWAPTGLFGEDLKLELLCPRVPRGVRGSVQDPDHPCFFSSPGGSSPLVHRVDRSHWETHEYDPTGHWAARVFATHGMFGTYEHAKLDAGVAYEQTFQIYWEVWYNRAAPQGHSPIPD